MNASIVSGLINNAALLVAMGLLYDVLFLREPIRKPLNEIVIGLILGTISIGVMLNPWVFIPGVIFDTRSVLLCITGYFFGTIPTLVAIVISAAYRLLVGGGGMWMGIAVIATSGLTGLVWRFLQKTDTEHVTTLELYELGLVTHFLMLLWTIALPPSMVFGVLAKISMPVLLIFPPLTVLLGKLMLNRHLRSMMGRSIRESEEKYRELVENANSIILKCTRNGRILFMNDYGLRFFGYRQEELLGRPIVGTIAPDTGASGRNLSELIGDVHENPSGKEKTLYQNRRKDGSLVWIAWTNHPSTDADGQVTGLLSVGTDNTDRVRAENALAESEQKWRNVLVNTPQIGISLATDGNIIFANSHFCQLTGWKQKEVIGRNWFQWFVPEDIRDEVRKVFDTVVKHKDTLEFSNYENEILTKNGEKRSVAWSNVLTKDIEGQVIDVTCLGVDLTERKQAEAMLQESAEYHQELFDNSPVAMYLQDFSIVEARIKQFQGVENLETFLHENPHEVLELAKSVVISDVNKAAVDLYRADSGDALKVSIDRFLVKNDWQHFIDQIVDFTGGIDLYEGEARNQTKDRKIIDVIVRKKVLNRHKNGLTKILVSITDVTKLLQAYRDREKLKSRLQQAQKMEAIGNLAGGIAHDFNNILFPVMGLSELLLDDLPAGSPEHGHAQEIFKASKRGSDLVKQILAFGRNSDNKMMPVLIQQVLEEVLKLSRSAIPSDIEITQDIQKDCGRVLADPTQLHQVAMNLITNAYHAVEPTGGKIVVTLREVERDRDDVAGPCGQPRRCAALSVSDSGCGIAPDIINKIFDPYFTTKDQGKGTGLGLAVVYGIVKKYGGDIKVSSGPGKGSTFDVYLPLVKKEAETDGPGKIANLPGGTERILLVDDEEAIVNLQRTVLERLGYRVAWRTASEAALALFRANPADFDLIITDMTMPNMTGDRLVKAVSAVRPGIPVIVTTGFSERMDGEKAAAIGINGFLMKPVTRSDLATMVRRVLDAAGSS